jgi:WD40 repeat protein
VHVIGNDGQEKWRAEAHPSTVSALSWSNTNELATACYGRVSFFDGSSGETTQKLEWKGSLISMALSPNGDVVACGSQDNSVHFWRRSTEKDSMMSGYPTKPDSLAFNRNGSFLATGGGDTVIVWSFENGGPEGTRPGLLEIHDEPISSLSFAPRGNRLASGAKDGGVVLWDLQADGAGNPIGAALMPDIVSAISWRPDGRMLGAVDARGNVNAWRVRT